jgi:hypothetical protein
VSESESLDINKVEGDTVMNQQDSTEPNDQQPVIEDLAVNQDHSAEVKGGPTYGRGQYRLFLDD